MKKLLSISIVLLLAFIGFNFAEEKLQTLTIGSKAPLKDHQMKSTTGNKESLASLKNNSGLIVVFSCNTCPFVIGGENFEGWEKEYNQLAKLANENNLGFVLINSNEAKRKKGDGFEDMKLRAVDKAYTMPYLYDSKHKLADAFGAKTTPHIFMFDAEMTLIYEGAIDNTWKPKFDKKENYLIDAIEAHSSKSEIKNNKTAPKGCSIKRKS